jgi:hypothetical protein
VPRRILGPKKVAGELRKLHNKELNNLYRVMKQMMRCLTRIVKVWNAKSISVIYVEGTRTPSSR